MIKDNNRPTTSPLPAQQHFLAAIKRTVHQDTVTNIPLELWSTGHDVKTTRNMNPVIRYDSICFHVIRKVSPASLSS